MARSSDVRKMGKALVPVIWFPFLRSCLGSACAALSVILWAEKFVLGLCPSQLRSLAFGGAVLFLASKAASTFWDSCTAKPTPDTNVTSETGTLRGDVEWVASGMRGWRESMEDEHVVEMLDPAVFPDTAVFAVLDGHGGANVSALASGLLSAEIVACGRSGNGGSTGTKLLRWALEAALPRLDDKIRKGPWGLGRALPQVMHPFDSMGSTCVVAAVDFVAREVVVANVGDSRAMLIQKGKAVPLSEDHKPENPIERNRIKAAGGQVIKVGPCHRVDGNLNLSRALGDFNLKSNDSLPPEQQKVSCFPDFMQAPFIGGNDELLVVACDGLFERLSNQELADMIWSRFRRGMDLKQISKEVLQACCARGQRGRPIEEGTDNETLVLAKLPPAKPESSAPILPPGTTVRISGLDSDAGSRLNDQVGVIEGPSSGSDRYAVRLSAGGETKSLKASNLTVVETEADSSPL